MASAALDIGKIVGDLNTELAKLGSEKSRLDSAVKELQKLELEGRGRLQTLYAEIAAEQDVLVAKRVELDQLDKQTRGAIDAKHADAARQVAQKLAGADAGAEAKVRAAEAKEREIIAKVKKATERLLDLDRQIAADNTVLVALKKQAKDFADR